MSLNQKEHTRKIRPLLFILLCAFFLLFLDYLYFQHRIYPGVYLKSIHLGNKTFLGVEKTLQNAVITFVGPEGKSHSVPLAEIGILLDHREIFTAGYHQGRQKSHLTCYGERLKIMEEGVFIPFRYELDENAFLQGIASLAEALNREAENAHFLIGSSNKVEMVPEKDGYRINKERLVQLLEQNLTEPDTPLTIRVPYDTIPPQITVLSLKEKGIETLMSSFTTSFDPANTNRVHNIKLAASILHNYFLAPGEILSLNELFGDSTPEKGYREAPIIMGTELVPGYGGGLCQISTTLYNAALLADLDIIERHNHRLTVPYISPGRDATISYNTRDLKFRNNKEHYILIAAEVEGDKLTFRFFGRSIKQRIEISTNILAIFVPPVRYEINPELPPGKEEIIEGSPGYRVEVWKLVYEGNELKSREKISVDTYLPYATVIQQGPG